MRWYRFRKISRELVEDLNLARFCFRGDYGRGDTFWIDHRRYRRELRRLPKLRQAARQQFEAQVIVLDDPHDGPWTAEQKAAALAWYDQHRALRRSTPASS